MLRVIAGEFKNRWINTPEGEDKTRPLPEKVRGAVLNMLRGHIEGQAFFDAFAGTGSFGIEALSRGAKSVVFIEKDREISLLLKGNLDTLGIADRAEVFLGDVLGAGALSRCPRPVHVVFFDPPYPMVEDPATRARVFEQFAQCVECLDDEGYAIIRTPWPFVDRVETGPEQFVKNEVSLEIPGAVGPETHAYGSTAVHWYMRRKPQ